MPVGAGEVAADKRQAIEQAARAVFGRLGYARAPIDVIAAEAGVSTRTLYNHFGGKLALFSHVLVSGATEVADAFERHVAAGFDASSPRRSLRVLADAIVEHRARFPAHFALVARLQSERDQFPAPLIEAWLQAGPRRVRAVLEDRLTRLATAAGAPLPDPATASRHLVALVTSTLHSDPEGGRPPTEKQVADVVEVFAKGYGFDAASTSTPGRPAYAAPPVRP
jgi:AcrR family transcriptional regulator